MYDFAYLLPKVTFSNIDIFLKGEAIFDDAATLGSVKQAYYALKSDGTLILKTENRFSPLSLLGILINHSKTTTNQMHDYWKLKQLLYKMGFKAVIIFGCYPNNKTPEYIYSLEEQTAVKFIFKRIVKQGSFGSVFFDMMSKSMFLTRLFSPSFIIFGFKTYLNPSEYLTGELVLSGSDKFTKYAKIIDFNKKHIIRVLRDRSSKNILLREVRLRESFRTYSPKLVYVDECHGYMIENFVSGDTLEHLFNKDISNSLNLIRQAFEKLLQFYSSQMFSYISADKYIFQLTNELEKYRQLFSVDKYLNDFVKLIKFLVKEEKWAEKNIAVVLLHGDFCLKNILWSRDKASLHFIDWEFCREGSVLYDFFHLISCIDYARLPETVNRHPDDSFNECMIEILDEFSNRFNLDSKSVRIMSYIFLAERVLFTLKLFEENKILAKVTDEIKQWHELMETLVMAMPSSSEYSKLKKLNGGKIISYA